MKKSVEKTSLGTPIRKLLFRVDQMAVPVPNVEHDESQILAYLRGCEKYALQMCAMGDPYIDQFTNKPIPVQGFWRTDGEWAWPDRTIYYLKKYHLALPAKFLSHGRSLGWEVQPISEERIKLVIKRVLPSRYP